MGVDIAFLKLLCLVRLAVELFIIGKVVTRFDLTFVFVNVLVIWLDATFMGADMVVLELLIELFDLSLEVNARLIGVKGVQPGSLRLNRLGATNSLWLGSTRLLHRSVCPVIEPGVLD